VRNSSGRRIAHGGGDHSTCQGFPQVLVTVPRKELAQVFSQPTFIEIAAQEPLNRIRYFIRQAAISDGTSNALIKPNRAADAEVIGILQTAIDFDLLAFDSDVCDPVLAATVGHPVT